MDTDTLLNECLQDSPSFRAQLTKQLNDFDVLESRCLLLQGTCQDFVKSGELYSKAMGDFLAASIVMSKFFTDRGDHGVASKLDTFIHKLDVLRKYFDHYMVSDLGRCIVDKVQLYVDETLRPMKNEKFRYDNNWRDYNVALGRFSEIPKARVSERFDAEKQVSSSKLALRQSGLSLVAGLSHISSDSVVFIRETFLSVVEIFADYISFCHGQLDDKAVSDLKLERRGVMQQQDDVNDAAKKLNTRLRHLLETSAAASAQSSAMPSDSTGISAASMGDSLGIKPEVIKKQGYLFRKPESRMARHWPRRWFVIEGCSFYYTRPEEQDAAPTVVVPDVRLVNIREVRDSDRRYCFEIVLINQQSHVFQAESEEDMRSWINACHKAASQASNIETNGKTNGQPVSSNGNGSSGGASEMVSKIDLAQEEKRRSVDVAVLKEIASVSGNNHCADCYSPKPSWYSQNLGCLLCIECSGVHRGLTVDVSRVRSLQLDELPIEMVLLLKNTGNNLLNELLEEICPVVTYTRQNWDRQARAEFISRKYIKKEFITSFDTFASSYHYFTLAPPPAEKVNKQVLYLGTGEPPAAGSSDLRPILTLTPNLLLARSAEAGNVRFALNALSCWGADPNCELIDDNRMTPLMLAARNDRVICAELLLAHGARVDAKDSRGQTPLIHATLGNSTAVGCLLLLKEMSQRLIIEHITFDGQTAHEVATGSFQNSDLSSAIRIAEAALSELCASGRESVMTEDLRAPGTFSKSSGISMAVDVIRTILEAKLNQPPVPVNQLAAECSSKPSTTSSTSTTNASSTCEPAAEEPKQDTSLKNETDSTVKPVEELKQEEAKNETETELTEKAAEELKQDVPVETEKAAEEPKQDVPVEAKEPPDLLDFSD